MKRIGGGSAVAAGLMLLCANAQAGVVIGETDKTVYIQGNKYKKVERNGKIEITDLDQKVVIETNADASKVERTPLAETSEARAAKAPAYPALVFKANGKHATIAGFVCDQYEYYADKNLMGLWCFAPTAPGAAEYVAYQRKYFQSIGVKIGGGGYPAGVPVSAKMGPIEMDGVTSVQVTNLPPETFLPPQPKAAAGPLGALLTKGRVEFDANFTVDKNGDEEGFPDAATSKIFEDLQSLFRANPDLKVVLEFHPRTVGVEYHTDLLQSFIESDSSARGHIKDVKSFDAPAGATKRLPDHVVLVKQ